VDKRQHTTEGIYGRSFFVSMIVPYVKS